MVFLGYLIVLFLLFVVFGQEIPRRTHIDSSWMLEQDPDRNAVTIAIVLNTVDLEEASNLLLTLSDPHSENYGRYWSRQDIAARFAPSRAVLRDIISWIHQAQISSEKIKRSGNIFHVSGGISEIQRLLEADVSYYKHKRTGARTVGFETYRIPANIIDHISSIFVHDIPQPRSKRKEYLRTHQKIQRDVDDCTTEVTPECLRSIYRIPFDNFTHPDNSLGVFLPGWSTWIPEDLDGFFAENCPELLGYRPSVVLINDGYQQTDVKSDPFNLEPNLDMEYTSKIKSHQYPLWARFSLSVSVFSIPTGGGQSSSRGQRASWKPQHHVGSLL